MKIVLDGETAIVLTPAEGMLTIEARSADEEFSPFHMIGAALASCTFAVLYSWANHSNLQIDDLSIRVEWSFAEEPHRMSDVRMKIQWPSLPPQRKPAAERAARLCTVHATLTHSTPIETVVNA